MALQWSVEVLEPTFTPDNLPDTTQFLAGPRLWYIGASTSLQGSVPVTVTTAYLTAQ